MSVDHLHSKWDYSALGQQCHVITDVNKARKFVQAQTYEQTLNKENEDLYTVKIANFSQFLCDSFNGKL